MINKKMQMTGQEKISISKLENVKKTCDPKVLNSSECKINRFSCT